MRSEAQFRTQVRMVVADDADIGQLSTGERIAVAFVLNRPDLLEQYWGSMLEFRRSSRHRLDSRRPARPAQRLLASMTRRESSLNSPSTYVLDSPSNYALLLTRHISQDRHNRLPRHVRLPTYQG
jgi:hypothetical protein